MLFGVTDATGNSSTGTAASCRCLPCFFLRLYCEPDLPEGMRLTLITLAGLRWPFPDRESLRDVTTFHPGFAGFSSYTRFSIILGCRVLGVVSTT